MPQASKRQSSGRKGHYACDFCRRRKLKCDRPLPCTNCRSRGKTCRMETEDMFRSNPSGYNANTPASSRADTTLAIPASQRQCLDETVTTTEPLPLLHEDLLVEIQALRRITHRLEERVLKSTTSHQRHDTNTILDHPGMDTANLTPTSNTTQDEVSDFVTHLQCVSMSRSSLDTGYADDLAIKIERIQSIPEAPTYISQQGKPTRCIWLPYHDEAQTLVNSYIEELSYIQRVVHHPSLPATIDDLYRQIDNHEPVKPGHLVLLLSILASATHVWVPRVDQDSGRALFMSSAQGNAQTPVWIAAAYTILQATQDSNEPTLELIQGIIILFFIIANLEGFSRRCRSLISTALLLSQELNFHRIDHKLNKMDVDVVRNEMGRRVWWYLVATDWLLAARYGGPGEGIYQSHPSHMTVNKPRNLNDVDLTDHGLHFERPAAESTDMSYFLQRIRLAEISRSIVDHNLLNRTNVSQTSYYSQIIAIDSELDRLIVEMPQFFKPNSRNFTLEPNVASNVFIQGYMLNSLIHTQRCKLHLTYLTTGPNNNPSHAASRETCLNSARHITSAETRLLRSQHPFVRVRLRLAAILYSIFMASIALLMDACVSRPASLEKELRQGEVSDALKILEDVGNYSLAATKLHQSLMQIVARYRTQHQHQQSKDAPLQKDYTLDHQHHIYGPPTITGSLTDSALNSHNGSSVGNTAASRDPIAGVPMALSSKELENQYATEWYDLFSDLSSSSSSFF